MEGIRLLNQGLSQSEVARQVKASHRSVGRWAQAYAELGRAGRKPRLSGEDVRRLERGLLQGPEALGYETPLWTSRRVADLIEQEFGVRCHAGHVWRILVGLGWSCQRPEGRTIVFRDESGWSQRPHRVRTWARKRQTAVLEFNCNGEVLSAMAGMTFWNFYFQFVSEDDPPCPGDRVSGASENGICEGRCW